nr:acylphosphatase [Spirochaetota bacterium]
MERIKELLHLSLRVTGIVQGVGFRPFVYRLALKHGMVGAVRNDTRGVLVHAQGPKERVRLFVDELRLNPPPLSRIDSITIVEESPAGFSGFKIEASEELDERSAIIPP